MALVNIDSAERRILELIRKSSEGHGVEVLSYKRNRGIVLLRTGEDSVAVTERGYVERTMTVALSRLPKVPRSMIVAEFPRSRKVRLYRLSDSDAVLLTEYRGAILADLAGRLG